MLSTDPQVHGGGDFTHGQGPVHGRPGGIPPEAQAIGLGLHDALKHQGRSAASVEGDPAIRIDLETRGGITHRQLIAAHLEGQARVAGQTDDRAAVHLEGEVAGQFEELIAPRSDEGLQVDDLQLHERQGRTAPRHIQFDPAGHTRAVGHGDVLRHHATRVVKVDGDPINAGTTNGVRHLEVDARLFGRLARLTRCGRVESDTSGLLNQDAKLSPNDARTPRVGAGDQLERRRRARHQEIPVGAALHHIVTLELHEVEHRGLEVPQVDHRQRLARESIRRLHRHLDHQRLGGLRGHSTADGEILRGSGVVVIDRGLTGDRGRVEQADAQQRRELEHRLAPTVFHHVALEGDATLRCHHHGDIGACDACAEPVHAHGQAAGTTRGRAINLDLQAAAGALVEVGATLQLDEATDLHTQIAAQLVLTHLEIRHLNGGHHTADFGGAHCQTAGRLPDLDDTARVEDVVIRLEDELAAAEYPTIAVAEQLHRGLRDHRVAQAHIGDLDVAMGVVGPLGLRENQLIVLVAEGVCEANRAGGPATITQQGLAIVDRHPRGCTRTPDRG